MACSQVEPLIIWIGMLVSVQVQPQTQIVSGHVFRNQSAVGRERVCGWVDSTRISLSYNKTSDR